MKIKMITQDNCPKCIALEIFLEKGLRNKYKDDIQIIHRSEEEELFMQEVEEHGIMATPALIAGSEVLRDTAPSKVSEFLKKYSEAGN